MTWTILQLAFPLVVVGIALHLLRTQKALLIGFREQLAVSPKGRRFILLVTMLALLVYHFVALCGTADSLSLLPSSILTLSLFSQRCGEGIVRLLQQRLWGFLTFLLMMGAFFLPETTPMAVTVMMMLIISWGFPTESEQREMPKRGDTPDIIEETIIGLRNEMQDILPAFTIEEEAEPCEAEEVDFVTEPAEAAPDDDVENSMNGAPLPYVGLSEKAIRNRKLREKERERRHNRAKRKARRAKHGR